MLLFVAAPAWLWVSGAAVAAGGWALLSGHRRVRAVSSVRLWEGLGVHAGETARRRVDPVWLLVFLALVLAGLGLARPVWRVREGVSKPLFTMTWAVRSLRQRGMPEQTELFVRAPQGILLPSGKLTLSADGDFKSTTAKELQAGATLLLSQGKEDVTAILKSGRRTIAWAAFAPPAGGRPSAFFKITGHDLAIDPALARVFAVRPGAEEGNAGAEHGVALINDPDFSMSALPGNAVLVIAEPRTPLPGLVPGERVTADGAGWKLVAAPNRAEDFVEGVAGVRVSAMRRAQMDSNWNVLATANGLPWLAARQWSPPESGRKIELLWLASEPAAETTWPKFASFVIFFGSWTDRSIDAEAAAPDPFLDWRQLRAPSPASPHESRDLADGFGGLSAILAVMAAGWFLWRGREWGNFRRS